MKKTCFCLNLSSSGFWISGLLFCLSILLPVRAQDEFTAAFAPAAVTYSNTSSAGFPAPVFQGRAIAADFDADGDTDILYQNGTNGSPIRYARNNGNAVFTDLAQSDSPFSGLTLPDNIVGNYHPADYDADGDIDLWVSAGGASGSYFRNNGNSFSAQSSASFPAAAFAGRKVVADFDADGDADILYQTGANGTAFRYARNNGNAAFADLAQTDSPFAAVTLPDNGGSNYYPADYDTDGDTDIWVGANAATGTYFRNDGNFFSLQSSATFPAPSFVARIKVADFDSDGDRDILYQTGADGTAFRYARNNGAGTFTDLAQTDSPFAGVTLPNILGSNYYLGDFDTDTDVDIWVALNNTTGSYFMQNDRPPFIASSNPADNAVNVPVSADISITFNETVTKGAGSIRILRVSDNAIIETISVSSAQVTGANASYTINPAMNFAPNTAYAVRFDAGTFRDADGAIFPGIGNNTRLNFTTLPPTTAATVSLMGRALTASNRSIANASITLVGSDGEMRFARTNQFGYYRFDELEIGTYVVTIRAKRYEFAQNSQVLTIMEDEEDFNFVGTLF